MSFHQQVWEMETASLNSGSSWLRWIAKAERIIGHSLDGDEGGDGYSLDSAHDAFSSGSTPEQYVARVQARA